MRTVVCDIETNGLIDHKLGTFPSTIWCIVAKDWETGEVFQFTANDHDNNWDVRDFKSWASKEVNKWIGHNFLLFDAPVLNKLLGLNITVDKVWDTLILSRLAEPAREGGHSLEAWGKRLGRYKPEHEDWSRYSVDMLRRCSEDVEINHLLMRVLTGELRAGKPDGFSKYSMRLEHDVAAVLDRRRAYGAYMDVPRAKELLRVISEEADALEEQIASNFPAEKKEKRTFVPRVNKSTGLMHGQDRKSLDKAQEYTMNNDGSYTIWEYIPFNLRSRPQVVEKMNEAGWKPYVKTKSGLSWKLCEENFDTLPQDAPDEYHKIVRWNMLDNRRTIIDGKAGWLQNVGHDGRIHGRIESIGTWTHRMSHSAPQMGNIPAARNAFGKEMRMCWEVGPENRHTHLYMGTDLSAIQLRILAHYMDDPVYTEAVANGKQEDKTDVHNFNVTAAEGAIATRDDAKTTIYAMLLGASDTKLGAINGGGAMLGAQIRENLFRNIPGFKKVDQMCEQFAKRKYFLGIDGRKITVYQHHGTLAAMLQEGEATVMKLALVKIDNEVRRRGLDYRLINVVHDELQGEVLKEHAEEVEAIQHQAIREAGEFFELRCPLAAETKVGVNWYETH